MIRHQDLRYFSGVIAKFSNEMWDWLVSMKHSVLLNLVHTRWCLSVM